MNINCDLGEGLENDALLMPYLDSCNVACGGHAGDMESMREAIRLAKIFNVKAGAHPSYPDRSNFGRKVLDIPIDQLSQSLIYQIKLFQSICEEENYNMHHIKPHGALYNEAARNMELALMICDILAHFFPDKVLYCPPHSIIEHLAREKNIPIQLEAFADRNYQNDYSLVNRSFPDAVISNVDEVIHHVRLIIEEHQVKTISGEYLPLYADTLCIHGDNEQALEILKAIRKNFKPIL